MNGSDSANFNVYGSGVEISGEGSGAYGDHIHSTAVNSVTLGNNSTNDRNNTVSVGSSGSERQMTNLAAGSTDTDATNLRQVLDADAATLNSVKNYTDTRESAINTRTDVLIATEQQARAKGDSRTLKGAINYTEEKFGQLSQSTNKRFAELDNKIDRAEKRLNAGIAGVTAIASIPYVTEDSFSYGIGLGNYQNANAIAAGVQYKTSPNTNVRLNVSWDSAQNSAIGIGFSGG